MTQTRVDPPGQDTDKPGRPPAPAKTGDQQGAEHQPVEKDDIHFAPESGEKDPVRPPDGN